MQKKSNKNTNPATLSRPLATKQPDSFIKNSVKNSVSDGIFQKSSNYAPQSYDAHNDPYEAIRADAKSNLRPAPNDEYETYPSHQNNMQVESLGYRDVQNVADKVLSPEELRRQYQPVSRPLKEDHKEAVPIKGKGVGREVQAARDRLSTFNLGDLKVTKKGTFDNRYNETKEYLAQCAAADVDPLDYYYENFDGEQTNQVQNVSQPQKEAVSIKGKGVSREVQAARDRLSKFNLGDLKITKKGLFDNRYNETKEYLAQCAAAEVDPLDYYKENFGELKPNTSYSEVSEVKSGSRTQLSRSDHSNDVNMPQSVSKKEAAPDGLYYNLDGSLDMRYKKNQIAMMIAEAKEKLSKIDTSTLKRTKDGKLDGRYKENKEYLALEKQCHEEYYAEK